MMQIDVNVIQQALGQKEFEIIALRSEITRLQKENEELKKQKDDNVLPFEPTEKISKEVN